MKNLISICELDSKTLRSACMYLLFGWHGDIQEFLELEKKYLSRICWSVYSFKVQTQDLNDNLTFSHFYFLMGKRGIASQVKRKHSALKSGKKCNLGKATLFASKVKINAL